MAYKSVYDAELEYILDILVVVLGKERFGRFAEFIDNNDHEFAELVAKRDSTVNPQNYNDVPSSDLSWEKKRINSIDICPICGEDRNHPSQHGNHTC